MSSTSVVIPNWNGAKTIGNSLDSLISQEAHIIVVDNGSTDGSVKLLGDRYPKVELITLPKNLGFAGGVNVGIKRVMELGSKYVALLNNDAVVDEVWLKSLLNFTDKNPGIGIVTSKILDRSGGSLDSTGEDYSIWGLPYPRDRGETDIDKYDNHTWVFGASGAASLYRVKMLKEIGLFDKDFFAYYEDVDISFRAQLAGWKVGYQPKALVYHQIGTTTSKIKDFNTYQTMKNLPWLMWKNVPTRLLPTVLPRFTLAYSGFYFRAISRGQFWPATKGLLISIIKWPKKMVQRYKIQTKRKVSPSYINSIIVHDLPPNARKLRALRNKWWHLRGKTPK